MKLNRLLLITGLLLVFIDLLVVVSATGLDHAERRERRQRRKEERRRRRLERQGFLNPGSVVPPGDEIGTEDYADYDGTPSPTPSELGSPTTFGIHPRQFLPPANSPPSGIRFEDTDNPPPPPPNRSRQLPNIPTITFAEQPSPQQPPPQRQLRNGPPSASNVGDFNQPPQQRQPQVDPPQQQRPPTAPVQSSSQRQPTGSRTTFGSCTQGTSCVPMNECTLISFLEESDKCTMANTGVGICCPNIDNGGSDRETPHVPIAFPESTQSTPSNPLSLLPRTFPLKFPTLRDVQQAVQAAILWLQRLDNTESELAKKQLFARPQSQEDSHQNFFGNNEQSIQLSRDGEQMTQAAVELTNKFGLNDVESRSALKKLSFANSLFADTCPKNSACQTNSRYRTMDGSCNNQRNNDWGKAFTAFNRIVFPAYVDGTNSQRTVGKSGSELPSARQVSFTASPDIPTADKFLTNNVMQHSCGAEFDQNPSLRHPACFSIAIPANDPFYAQHGQTCMSFVRSASSPRRNCNVGPREQLNQQSAYIDGSMIYGATQTTAQSLRTFRGGKLASSMVDNSEFLPKNQGSCGIPADKQLKCFRAGDDRVNVQPNLVVMHAVWLRQHNRIAERLSRLNPRWNDETLYQEARKIVIAQLQHITYNEFLPIVLGNKVMRTFGLRVQRTSHASDYEPKTDATIINAFAAAAYRLHTLIPSEVPFMDNKGTQVGQLDLSEAFNNPSVIYERDAFSRMINGLSDQSVASFDRFFTNQISNHLFRAFGAPFGIDLVALNIQRGRDHGLPDYNTWREACGLKKINSFDELPVVMQPGAADRLKSLYRSVDDVDLFIGGVSEIPFKDSLVGPTFSCIIAEQFRRLKRGDRYWYENGEMPHSFTEDQLQEIRKTTLARVLCDNGITNDAMQKNAMIQPIGDWNRKVSCNGTDIPATDLSKWRR